MKYIKRYNEAIGPRLTKKEYDEETGITQSVPSTGFQPEKFRRAGALATSANQTKKSGILRDYADEKEFGYYNVTVLKNRTGYLEKNVKVTDLRIDNVRYGVTPYGKPSQILTDNNYSVDDTINNWKMGNGFSLGLTFDVSFRLLNSSKSELDGKSNGYFNELINLYRWTPFSISLVLSKESYGLKDFIKCQDCDGEGEFYCYECDGSGEEYGGGKCQECDGYKGAQKCESCKGTGYASSVWVNGNLIPLDKDENGKPIYDVQALFEDSKKISLTISPKEIQNGNYTAVFSDKRSAIEFTKDLPKLVDKNEDFRRKLTELLGILSHDPSEDLEEAISVFTKVSNNRLLPEKPQPNEKFYNNYFYKKIAEI